MDNIPFRWDHHFGDLAVIGIFLVYSPVRFETGTPMQFRGKDQLPVPDIRIPKIEDNADRPEPPFIGRLDHVPEVAVFILPVF